jgi:hypothetical protein
VRTGFRPQFLDFRRGIHVGNLEDHERITRILKLALEERYGQPFVTERWGRGVYWQWIGYLVRANRDAKPASNASSFGCAKFFLMVDTEEERFKCGMQVERGYVAAPREYPQCRLAEDWDYHRLRRSLRAGSAMAGEIERLVRREEFWIDAGGEAFYRPKYKGVGAIRAALDSAPKNRWAGFQLYYPMTREEVQNSNGADLVESMLAVFREVTPAMNLCMQVELTERR